MWSADDSYKGGWELSGWAVDMPEGAALRLQLDVPVQIVQPAFVQVVGREPPAVVLEFVHRRAVGRAAWRDARFAGRAAALGEVAGRAGGDDVLPGGAAAARAGDHVVERQVVAAAAVLAGERIAQEQVESREGRRPILSHIALQRHHARQAHLEGGGV